MSSRIIGIAACAMALGLTLGCTTERTEHERDARASYQDSERRAAYDHCRAAGQTDCDRILNGPIDPEHRTAPPPASSMDADRQAAYDRCRAAGDTDCDRYLR